MRSYKSYWKPLWARSPTSTATIPATMATAPYGPAPVQPTGSILPGWLPGKTYYWQVRSSNTIGTTYVDGGAFWSFTTQGLEKVYLPLVSRP